MVEIKAGEEAAEAGLTPIASDGGGAPYTRRDRMATRMQAVIFDNDNTIAKIYPNPKIYWKDVFVKTVEECGGSVPKGREEEYMLS